MALDFLPGNRLQLLENGAEFFPALLRAIDAAREEVRLETYIFECDEIGEAVLAALVRAAARGVRTYLLVDGFGSREFILHRLHGVAAAGVEVEVYRPLRGPWFIPRRHRLRRLHRKLACCDGRIAFVGGINILSDFTRLPGRRIRLPRWDYAVRIEGPLVRSVQQAMQRLWRLVCWTNGRRRPPRLVTRAAHDGPAGPHRAVLVLRDNWRHRHDIENAYLHMLARARKEVWIACAYFFPGKRFRRALAACTARGVRVRLVLQGLSDHPILSQATRALYPWLLRQGVELWEYHATEMHAKVAVFDDRYATVGSSNIDPFSLFMAREANVWVDDLGFSAELRARLEQHVAQGAVRLDEEGFARLPRWRKALSWVVLGWVRLIIGWAGYTRDMEG